MWGLVMNHTTYQDQYPRHLLHIQGRVQGEGDESS